MLSVLQIQRNLYFNGFYYTGALDGIEGKLTKNGVIVFQKDHGLVADGIVGFQTEKALVMRGKTLQYLLNLNGASLVLDGLVGAKTIIAAAEYQKKYGLAIDSIAGKNTYKKLRVTTVFPHFNPKNDSMLYTCHCGKPKDVDLSVFYILEKIRKEIKQPIIVTSGCRCANCNKKVGGIASSMHLYGKAVDFVPKNTKLETVKKIAENNGARYSYYGTKGLGNAIHFNI